MVIDLDRWLADEGAEDAGGRVFPHDLFISHRRFDLPSEAVEAVSACGANVIWDCDLDLRDRRVMQGVAFAMRRARFVALYVSDAYTDSPWCRAEYMNALWIEETYKVQRAFVICESNRSLSSVPECLRAAPAFAASDPVQIAQFVVSGNLLGVHSAARLRSQVPPERLSPDFGLLSFDEQLNLLEQRLFFWAERGVAQINVSQKERLAGNLADLMSDGITEPEKIFRDVSKIVFDPDSLDHRRAEVGDQELNRVVRMVSCVAECQSSPTRNPELRGLDKWAYDFLLKPLLAAVEMEHTRAAAATAYRAMCVALRCGAFVNEVPVYLSVMKAVESGQQDVHSAISSHRMLLYEAASASRRRTLS